MSDTKAADAAATTTYVKPTNPTTAVNPKGEHFTLAVITVNQERFSSELAKTFLTADQIKKCYNAISFVTYKSPRINKAEKPKFTPPNLSNMTLEGAIDMLGQVREQKSEAKKLEGIYKDFIAALRGEDVRDPDIEDDEERKY